MTKLLHYIGLVILTTALSGCGFQLRDNYQLPAAMQAVSVQAPAFSEFSQVLQRRLSLAGAELVDSAQAGVTIEVLSDQLDRRTLSLSQSGQVAEYEMIYTVNYQIIQQGSEPKKMQVEVYRDYQDDPNFALAKTREREVLIREMRDDAARQLLRQTIAQLSE
ncbi:LPS assembly lipoprotein LptE [Pseudidiomarina gelatinasegens]|uniref:LPS-assembly lipoprotein LptE n=1 Tax=Pseudidiomarina gelatinasegens TaxID=2487740 RepID=UPI0030ED2843|tara:strand:+ start:1803 stop:2291 length:489 start_codon:yes stop_codon:yes gene_type:complete